MTDQQVTTTANAWREQIAAYQALLDELRPQLIDAEAHLAEQLAAISAFEVLVRSRFERLTQRLDKLQAEIDDLRRQMRTRRFAWEDEDGFGAGRDRSGSAWEFGREGAAAAGRFRYREAPPDAVAPSLPAEQQADLRRLYRQLARRFHPDLALDEAERDRRTAIMMRINTAYAAGDLARLEQIALEPDLTTNGQASDQELAESLGREVERCRLRLAEIKKELAALEGHESTQLLRRSERATVEGRDLLDELATDLRRQINEKMVERDVLQTQLEESEDDELDADALADVLYDLRLEEAGDADYMAQYSEWRASKSRRWAEDSVDNWSEDDIEDILDDHD
jgi:hypothetical protein